MELFTTKYDDKICGQLKHLQNYPEMKPFIGKYWDSSPYRLLILGESHYIPADELEGHFKHRNHINDWYNNTSTGFYADLSCYINTRDVVNKADKVNKVDKEFKYSKTLSIYYNVKAAFKNNYTELANENFIFPYISYYNYFQRPAFKVKESIEQNTNDNDVAYQSLKSMVEIIQPSKIIFCSRKAAASFNHSKKNDATSSSFDQIIIDNVPHPSCKWWNTPSKPCGGRTGNQKFIDILNQKS